LTSSRLFTKTLSWHAKQSIPHIIVMFHSYCVQMCKDLNFGDKRTGCCITTTHRITPPFHQKYLTVVPHTFFSPDLAPCDFSLFPQLKIPPFWHKWGDWGRTANSAEHTPRTWCPGCI
jgi:hypothetical protein